MAETARSRLALSVMMAGLILVCDAALLPLIQAHLFRGTPPVVVYLIEFILFTFLAVAGLALNRCMLIAPLVWWPRRADDLLRAASVAGASLVLVGANIVGWHSTDVSRVAPWLESMAGPRGVFFLSLRADLTEEVAFRLFLLGLIAWLVSKATRERAIWLGAGVLGSSILFGPIHPGFVLAFSAGLVMCCIYLRAGLVRGQSGLRPQPALLCPGRGAGDCRGRERRTGRPATRGGLFPAVCYPEHPGHQRAA